MGYKADYKGEIMEENLKKDFHLIIQACKEINLPVFLHAGTLLGAIRNNDFNRIYLSPFIIIQFSIFYIK